MRDLVIFGASAFAEIAHYYFTHDSPHSVTAFSVDGDHLEESRLAGLPVVPFEDLREHFPPSRYAVFVAIGMARVNAARREKFEAACAMGYELTSYVSSRAMLWPDFVSSPNMFVTGGTRIQPFVRIGKNVVLWNAGVGHHTTIGDHCLLSSCIVSGGVTVGESAFIGVGATIREGVRIGRRCVIGAGALILRDTQDNEVYQGRSSRPSAVPSDRLGSLL